MSHLQRARAILSYRKTMVSLGELDNNEVFKVVNLTVAALAVLCGISQLFSGIHSLILGVYIIAYGATVGTLEFRIPSQAVTYGSFLFSFVGRGVSYILLSAIINGASWFRLFAAIIIFLVGVVFIILENVPSIGLPDNMNPEGVSLAAQEEDVV